MIFEIAATDPDGIALDDLTRRRTWAEFLDRATRFARLLGGELGLKPDDHVALLMGNRVEFVELTFGAMLAGIWITPINWHLKGAEAAYVIDDSGAQVLFTDEVHEPMARQLAGARLLLPLDALEPALAGASDEPMPPDGPTGGTMIYTSGTTGRPKGVKRGRPPTLGAALSDIATKATALGLDGSGPHMVTGPLYHAAPLLFAFYDQVNGAPLVILPQWDDERALELLQERAIRHTHMVPTMFVRMLNLPETVRSRFDPSALRLVLHGAAPMSVAVKRRMIDWWGEVLVEYWGATEGGTTTLVNSADWLAHPGTVGRALPSFEVFAVDDQRDPLPPGEVGVLYCRHKHLRQVFEYHHAPEQTAEAHPEPFLFNIGDIGRVEEDGYVYLSDRKSNMIISGGVNIYPAEIEQVLQEHPAVADVGVFGIPDPEWGEAVKAAVELAPGAQPSPKLEAEIRAFARERLADYKVPRSIDFESQLPRYPTGKLHVRLLRDRYWKHHDRSI
jgi:acyl-CoA synthetase (AMP-forming)/AMP-acid ligase II